MTVEERLALLEQRLRRAEDELAIARLMASYGPLVDAGDADAVAGLWAEDGEYDVDGWHMGSRADVADMVRSPAHQGLISGGSAHFLGQVRVDVDGDTAVAVCESLVVRHNGDGSGYRVWRAGANHVTLRRTAVGWQIVKRTPAHWTARPRRATCWPRARWDGPHDARAGDDAERSDAEERHR